MHSVLGLYCLSSIIVLTFIHGLNVNIIFSAYVFCIHLFVSLSYVKYCLLAVVPLALLIFGLTFEVYKL